MRHRPALRFLLAFSLGLSAAACSGGSGGGSGDGFQLIRISVLEGAVWKVNQPITFTFNEDVDFSSVSLNTISIQTTTGTPATGTFFLADAREVVFQPNCPTQDDLLDSGLIAGSVPYQIRVLGKSSGASNTVRSASDVPLEVTQVRNFTTPASAEQQQAFLDTVQGPPVPLVRTEGSDEETSFLEIGGDPDDVVFFERDAITQDLVLSVPGFESPLNLYSEPDSKVAVVIAFNQALNPASTNISAERMRLEYFDTSGFWLPLETQVTLAANCTLTGARVRLDPVGILPQGTELRAVVLAGLQDLVGEPSSSAEETFAVVPTREFAFTSLSPADAGADEFPEGFDFGGDGEFSFQDTEALFASPPADWDDGRLSAAFQFDGTGGPGGEFDWLVANGDSVVIDTDDGAIVEADGVTVQLFTDGVIDLRNMTIEAGGDVRVQGSKPLVINATGTVIIRGTLDVSGFNAPDVVIPNTGGVRSEGGAGGPGGGRGGFANEVVTNSTPRGSFGQGPGAEPNTGGQGGETGFSAGAKDTRRPGGGAGGRFARETGVGLVAQNGTNGHAEATGAVDGEQPPKGGLISAGAFPDTATNNNFTGTRAQGTSANVTGLIRGELAGLWGGYGGGGGGNAVFSGQFPHPNWTTASDEKGGGGGGGGGGLRIRALGPIQFGLVGLIRCNGGRGGIGENTQALDHVAGNGGSGSGGHVILETASFVDFTDGGTVATNRDCITATGGPQITGATTSGGSVSFGGAGGAGVIQLHVPSSLDAPTTFGGSSDIFVPTPVSTLDSIASPAAIPLVPSFGSRSFARSEWISVGGAEQKSSGIPSLLQFLFQGVDTSGGADDGKVLTAADRVVELTPLLDQDLEGNPDVAVLADRLTLSLTDGALTPFAGTTGGVQNDLFLRTPALLEDFVLRLSVGAESEDYSVTGAVYDEGASGAGDEVLRVTVGESAGGLDLTDFISANTGLGTIHYRLIPRYFRILTGGIEGDLPASAYVRIRFQATQPDLLGNPDEASLLVDWTGDISQFNALAPGELQFFRFEVEFELATGGGAVTPDTLPVQLDFLKIPFLF